MELWQIVAAEVPKSPNLWGALGCAMAYAAALLAALDAFADLLLARGQSLPGRLGAAQGLKFGGKLAAAGITVSSAGIVLALDANWFALAALSVTFAAVIVVALFAMRRAGRSASAPAGATMA
ncbi:hypothetical protein ACI7YT_07150 [Microbacterium sp. M]|uniref:hypothetical protein n=1 Tax=Microbacterium sp. M TaxID=3377125 RepID=UPI00386FA32E